MEASPEAIETHPPEAQQNKPQTPPPEIDQNKHPSPPPIAEQFNHTSESQKSPEPNDQIIPDSDVAHKTNSLVHAVEKSPHHVEMDNTITAEIPPNHNLQEISRTLNMDLVEQTPPHHISNLNNLMQNLSDDCIYVPPSLPYRILNEPISETKEDITKRLK
ncbi:hypothetical protein QL285_015856 [Trifolium repens]|nr:hypothetical protein QL285_015856 [Trifolium repens]